MSGADPRPLEERIEALVSSADMQGLSELAEDLHPSDVADMVEALGDEARQIELLSSLSVELASEALAEMEEEDGRDLLAALDPFKGAQLLQELADDDAVDLIGELQPDERSRLLAALPVEDAGELRGLLEYDDESAGGLMTTEFVSVVATVTAGEALVAVREQGREVEDFYTVFVVDPQGRLLGTVRLDHLVTADTEERVEHLVEPVITSVEPHVDQEEVGRLIGRYNLASLPVVGPGGVLLGRITFDDVIDVIEAEQTEDILKLAGISDEEELRHSWTESVRTRLPWLVLNLLTAAMAASVILIYEGTIAELTLLAFIAPIIAALGGSSGTQSLAITIRRLTLEGNRGAGEAVGKEILVGLVNGAVLGLGLAGIALAIPDADPMLGVVVMLAMWGNQVVAGFAGAFIPTTLDRLGVDPSVASSVFVHTLTDLCGFFLLLGLASRLLL